ncbi:CobW family GTP-binding protein [Paenibacillus camerounensis]|uniref:CobW family GTP-binding protein n=1 Tax=Paenibacillus camerounensis TaxID=1243663 RepID=UPI0005AB771C|nr:GTP-binding protein [Paenibacillus camerounensis]
MSRVPVTVISGYLGSGKTTMLLHLLLCKEHLRIGLIVNDLAEVNVDAKTVEQSEFFTDKDRLVVMSSGSISSDLKRDLIEAVYYLAASGEVDLIIVEASGVALPQLIANTIINGVTRDGMPLRTISRLDTNVTVVDGYRILGQFSSQDGMYNEDYADSNQLIINQIEFCDVLVFNKIDLLAQNEKEYLTSFIRKIQPRANFIETSFSRVIVKDVLNTGLFDESNGIQDFLDTEDLSEFVENEADQLGIHSFVYRRREPFHPVRFDEFLDRWPREVTRCKGVMWLITQAETVFKISQSGRAMDIIPAGYWIAALSPDEIKQLFDAREGLKDIWDVRFGDRMIELVFIGKNMNKEQIIRELDACLVQEDESVDNNEDPFNAAV